MTKKELTVIGRVQGVGYRMFAAHTARALGLCGRVWNNSDGSVTVYVRGSEGQIDTLVKKLSQGPFLSKVREVKIADGTFEDFDDFRIQ